MCIYEVRADVAGGRLILSSSFFFLAGGRLTYFFFGWRQAHLVLTLSSSFFLKKQYLPTEAGWRQAHLILIFFLDRGLLAKHLCTNIYIYNRYAQTWLEDRLTSAVVFAG